MHDTIRERFPRFKIRIYNDLLEGFQDIAFSKYDLMLIDCEIKGFKNFHGVKLVRSFNNKAAILVTCREHKKHEGMRAVLEGADNYYIIRKDYKDMLEKILCLTLKMKPPSELIRKYAIYSR